MTDYTQLTDDALRRKVLELMGYSIVRQPKCDDVPELYIIVFCGQKLCYAQSESEAWQQVPDPLADASMYMALVDELGEVMIEKSRVMWAVNTNTYFINTVYSTSLPRAICEAYCQVKEQK